MTIFFTPLADTQTSREILTQTIAMTEPKEVLVGDPAAPAGTDVYYTFEGNGLQVIVGEHRECKRQRTETVRLKEKVVSLGCSDGIHVLKGGLYLVGVVSTAIGVGMGISKEKNETKNDGLITSLIVIGIPSLVGGLAMSHYCSHSHTEEKDLGTEERTVAGDVYPCRQERILNTEVGLILNSGTVLRGNTGAEGAVVFDLSGAEIEDLDGMEIYLPEQDVRQTITLSEEERKKLAYLLAPKQERLGPVYSELKSKARHAAVQCYENTFADKPVGGTIRIHVEVAPIGKVRKLSVDFDPGSLSAANACIWERISQLQFPKFEGEALSVRVPIEFEAPPPPPAKKLRHVTATYHGARLTAGDISGTGTILTTPGSNQGYLLSASENTFLTAVWDSTSQAWAAGEVTTLPSDVANALGSLPGVTHAMLQAAGWRFQAIELQGGVLLPSAMVSPDKTKAVILTDQWEIMGHASWDPQANAWMNTASSPSADALLEQVVRERAPSPEPKPEPKEAPKKVETVLVGGTPVVFVHDPSLGCTAGVAACQAAIMAAGGCALIRRETSRGIWNLAAELGLGVKGRTIAGTAGGAAAGAVCEQKMQEICAKAACE